MTKDPVRKHRALRKTRSRDMIHKLPFRVPVPNRIVYSSRSVQQQVGVSQDQRTPTPVSDELVPQSPDEVLETRSGSRAPYTMVGDWILLSTLTPHAKLLYALLAAHVNVANMADGKHGRQVWPSLETLAGWMSLRQPRSVSKYINELIAIGAITKDQKRDERNMRTRNVYTVNFEPAPGLATPAKFSDFYHQRTETARRRLIAARQDVVRSGALPASDGARVETIAAGQDVVCSNAGRSAPQHPDVVRPTAPEQDQGVQQEEVGSKSFSRDKSLEDELRARGDDRPLVEAGLKLSQEQSADCEEVEGLWGQDQALFAGDQLGSSTAKASAERDAEFEEFWTAYPRREKRADARRAWDKAIKKVSVATVMAGVARYVRHLAWWHPDSLDRNKHTAHPSSWLNGERWNDELPPEPTGQRKTSTNGGSNGYKPYSNPVDDSVYHEEIR